MRESLRLLNHHGMKLWFSALTGGLVVTVLLLVPHLFTGMMVGSRLASARGTLQELTTDPRSVLQPDRIGEAAAQVFSAGGEWLAAYAAFVAVLTVLVGIFYTSGLIASVHDAAVHDRVAVGRFFSEGLRKMFPLLGLSILQALVTGACAALAGLAWPLAGEGTGPMIAVAAGTGFLGLVLLSAVCHSLVVLFTEETGVFRSFGYGFVIAFRMFGRAFVSLLGALFAGLLGTGLVALVSLFPWLILQFFEDGTVALIVSVLFGGLLYLALGLFPAILAGGVLFRRYVSRIQDDLFPEDDMEATMLRPASDDEPRTLTRS